VKNLEFKARISSVVEAELCAANLGASRSALLFQRDTYFRVQEGRLKLRELGEGVAELISYQRGNTRGARWSTYQRYPVHDADTLRGMLGRTLGVLLEIRKVRRLYVLDNARIHIDEVEGLGAFVEFEIVGEETTDTGRFMQTLRRGFGFAENDGIAGSYADLMMTANLKP
jgi:predicted adenylyl cyclase CyaB